MHPSRPPLWSLLVVIAASTPLAASEAATLFNCEHPLRVVVESPSGERRVVGRTPVTNGLSETKVTSAALDHLHQLHRLHSVDVRMTRVDAAAAARLRQALPGCAVVGAR